MPTINFKRANTRNVVSVEVERNDTIFAIKQKIQNQYGILIQNQRLLIGRNLDNNSIASETGMFDVASVTLLESTTAQRITADNINDFNFYYTIQTLMQDDVSSLTKAQMLDSVIRVDNTTQINSFLEAFKSRHNRNLARNTNNPQTDRHTFLSLIAIPKSADSHLHKSPEDDQGVYSIFSFTNDDDVDVSIPFSCVSFISDEGTLTNLQPVADCPELNLQYRQFSQLAEQLQIRQTAQDSAIPDVTSTTTSSTDGGLEQKRQRLLSLLNESVVRTRRNNFIEILHELNDETEPQWAQVIVEALDTMEFNSPLGSLIYQNTFTNSAAAEKLLNYAMTQDNPYLEGKVWSCLGQVKNDVVISMRLSEERIDLLSEQAAIYSFSTESIEKHQVFVQNELDLTDRTARLAQILHRMSHQQNGSIGAKINQLIQSRNYPGSPIIRLINEYQALNQASANVSPVSELAQIQWTSERQSEEAVDRLQIGEHQDIVFNFGYKQASLFFPPLQAWAQEFLPNLFIGNQAAMLGCYDNINIYPQYDYIVDLSEQEHLKTLDFAQIQKHEHHCELSIPDTGSNFNELLALLDNQNTFRNIDEALRNHRRVLINCAEGMSRSATVAIIYLMRTYHVSFVQAYHHIKASRPVIEPNPGYVKAMLEYEKTINNIAPINNEVTREWFNEYAQDNCRILRELTARLVESSAVCISGKTAITPVAHDYFYSKDFINLISFLRVENIPFQLGECGKFHGNIVISHDDYLRLTHVSLIPQPPVQHAEERIPSATTTISARPQGPTPTGILITDLRETLVTNGYRNTVTSEVYTAHQLQTRDATLYDRILDGLEPDYTEDGYIVVGGNETIDLLRQLKQAGCMIAIATGDAEGLRAEIEEALATKNVPIDLVFNFKSLGDKLGITDIEAAQTYNKAHYYNHIRAEFNSDDKTIVHVTDDGFINDNFKNNARDQGYNDNQLHYVDSNNPSTLTNQLRQMLTEVQARNARIIATMPAATVSEVTMTTTQAKREFSHQDNINNNIIYRMVHSLVNFQGNKEDRSEQLENLGLLRALLSKPEAGITLHETIRPCYQQPLNEKYKPLSFRTLFGAVSEITYPYVTLLEQLHNLNEQELDHTWKQFDQHVEDYRSDILNGKKKPNGKEREIYESIGIISPAPQGNAVSRLFGLGK